MDQSIRDSDLARAVEKLESVIGWIKFSALMSAVFIVSASTIAIAACRLSMSMDGLRAEFAADQAQKKDLEDRIGRLERLIGTRRL